MQKIFKKYIPYIHIYIYKSSAQPKNIYICNTYVYYLKKFNTVKKIFKFTENLIYANIFNSHAANNTTKYYKNKNIILKNII